MDTTIALLIFDESKRLIAMPAEKVDNEKMLLALLAEDNEYAFQLLFDRHRNRVFKITLMYVKSSAIAEDIVQDVFLKLWFQRKNLLEIQCLESWIYTIAKNYTLNCLKKRANERTVKKAISQSSIPFDDTTDHKVRTAQYKEMLQQAIQQLPNQQQKVYLLAKEKGLSYEAIAGELSLSQLTVKTHMSRAFASIRSFLQKKGVSLVFFLSAGVFI